VLYALQALKAKPIPVQPRKKASKNVFGDLLKSINLKEYQDFVRQYAAKNKSFKTNFELYFAEKDERIDIGEKYEEAIQKIIKKHSERGYLRYRGEKNVAKEIGHLLKDGHHLAAKSNFRDAFALAKAVLKQLMPVLQHNDDSNGDLSNTIYETVDLLRAISEAEQIAPNLKEQVFQFIKQELDNPDYFSYGDMGYALMEVFQNLAFSLNRPQDFIGLLDDQIKKLPSYSSYRKESFLKQKLDFLELIGKPEEVAALVQQNLDIVEVRQGEVEKAIGQQDFAGAKTLLKEGIQLAEAKDHPGTVTRWQQELLRVAVLEKDTTTIRQLAYHLVFSHRFIPAYYQQWKATFTPAEWTEVIEKHITQTSKAISQAWENEKKSYWRPAQPPLLQTLAPIFIQEQFWDRLLELVQKENKLDTTLSFHSYLAPHYPAQLLAMYLPAFEAYGQKANGRSEYASLARKMLLVMQDLPAGRDKIKALAQRLKEQFPRRPAMLEELDKVLKKEPVSRF